MQLGDLTLPMQCWGELRLPGCMRPAICWLTAQLLGARPPKEQLVWEDPGPAADPPPGPPAPPPSDES